MDEFGRVEQLVRKAKRNYARMGKTESPFFKTLSMEGVDIIPLGGDSLIHTPEDEKE